MSEAKYLESLKINKKFLQTKDRNQYAANRYEVRDHFNYDKYTYLIHHLIRNEMKVLDVACSCGSVVERLIKSGIYNAFGFDNNPAYWDTYDNNRFGNHLFIDDIINLSHKGEYDIVLMLDILEHIPSDKEDIVLENIYKLCKNLFVISVGIDKHIGKYDISGPEYGGDETHINKRGCGYWEEKIQKDKHFILVENYTKFFNNLMGDKTLHNNEYLVFRKVL